VTIRDKQEVHVSFVPIKSKLKLKPIPMKERHSITFIGMSRIDVKDGAFVAINDYDDTQEERLHIPIGSFSCIMLEPGTRISHAAVALAAKTGTLLIWVGQDGVRTYSAGQPGGARSDRLLYQAKLALDPELRLKVVRKMFEMRFGEQAPQRRSVEQLRGLEGIRVKKIYAQFAAKYNVSWNGREYDHTDWGAADPINRCISAATACVYGITEAAILAAGYAPAIGFLHTGKPLSFVYDIADMIKFETVVPLAFKVCAQSPLNYESEIRKQAREVFRSRKTLKNLIPMIEEILDAGGIEPPKPYEDAQPPALPEPIAIGDTGHRVR